MSGIHFTSHVSHRRDPTRVGMVFTGPNSKRDRQPTGHEPAIDLLEGGGGADRHPSTRKPPIARRLTWVQGQKRYGDVYNGVEARLRSLQHRSIPPIPGLPIYK